MKMHETTARLFEAAKEKGLKNPADIARYLNKSQQVLKNWEERGVSARALPEVSEALGISEKWLRTGEADTLPNIRRMEDGETQDGQIRFERLNIEAACGDGIENLPVEVVDYVNVSRLWAKDKFGSNLAHIKIITARGDSMAGTINEGDVVFVDTAVTELAEDGVYLIHVSDGLRAKRLQRTVTGGVKILSDNKRYETETVEKHDLEQLKICGKIKGAWKFDEI